MTSWREGADIVRRLSKRARELSVSLCVGVTFVRQDTLDLYRPLACDAARCAPVPSFRLQCAMDDSFITHQTGRCVCAWRASLPQHRLRSALSAPTHSRTVVSIPSA